MKKIFVFCVMQSNAWVFAQSKDPSYAKVQELFDRRCVACHACASSPCQLDLASPDGVQRGANRRNVYDSSRVFPAKPSRLFIDAKSADEWHKNFGFKSVLKDHFLTDIVKLGREKFSQAKEDPIEYNVPFSTSCPIDDHDRKKYLKEQSKKGMPFGLPPLDDSDYQLLATWNRVGSPTEALRDETITDHSLAIEINAWEDFLNTPNNKQRITSRYLYEHWFLAHLYIPDYQDKFFRMVRSRTKRPAPVDEIATARPFDDPGQSVFYYRLRRITSTIVHKNHVTYSLGKERLARIKKLFIETSWSKDDPVLPSYQSKTASNPFKTFAAIPVRSRYQFFLDEAKYFADTFIRGPVCHGQVAVNVINDHFAVLFLDPDHDLAILDEKFLEDTAHFLDLPAAGENSVIKSFYRTYKKDQMAYQAFRARAYRKASHLTFGLESLWTGDQGNPNAALTVFRHFDNATVLQGLVGGTPESVWVMDYPIFERLYYLLVAGFDVFGNLFHQLSTRLYMDNLRVESENNFLYFFPSEERRSLRGFLYQDKEAQEKNQEDNPLYGESYKARDPNFAMVKSNPELSLQRGLQRVADLMEQKRVVKKDDGLSCCISRISTASQYTGAAPKELASIARIRGWPASGFPELSYLILESKSGPRIYSIARTSRHTDVSFLFDEKDRRLPQEDRLAIVEGLTSSYPNFFIHIDERDLSKLESSLTASKSAKTTKEILAKYGTLRLDEKFWAVYDRFSDVAKSLDRLNYGVFDLSHYEDTVRAAQRN